MKSTILIAVGIALIMVVGAAQADEVDELIATLQHDEYAQNRADAAFELGETGDSRAVEPLVEALRTETSSDVRRSAVSSLGAFDDNRALQSITTTIKEDENENVRYYAVWALQNFGDRSVDALIYALDDESINVRGSAASVLGALGATKATPSLCEMVHNDGDIGLRYNALDALGSIKDPASFDCLVEALSDPITEVKMGAALALGELGDPRAIPYLNESLSDPNEFVRSDAASAIEAINAPEEAPFPRLIGGLTLGLAALFRRKERGCAASSP
jgi:HEAT repeat protein